jgi:hypothetical protein
MVDQRKIEAVKARIAEAVHEVEELEREAAEETATPEQRRARFRLIRGGKALVLAPVAWAWAQVRDHAVAAVPLAATGVIGTAATLGVASPEIPPDPDPVSVTRVEEPTGFGSHVYRQAPTPTPSPTPTEAVEVVESEAIPALPAPTSAPFLLPDVPLPTETPLPEAVEPVEEVVWTTATAVVHCREVLLAVDLHGCVRGLLAG